MDFERNNTDSYKSHIVSEEDVEDIIKNSLNDKEAIIERFTVLKASDKMLGFLADYWKLQVQITDVNKERIIRSFFIKSVSVSNKAKAKMVKDMKLFEKELFFYSVIKKNLDILGIPPWSASLISILNEAMVFEDLNWIHYKTRNKLERFDKAHTLQALNTLARFHASSIIFEENRSKHLNRRYCINEEFECYLNRGGYTINDQWFVQCMTGALAAIKMLSKYSQNAELIDKIEARWNNVWCEALKLSDITPNRRGVICHRDLWNNNLLFHYKQVADNKFEPDDCLLVDFQAVRYQEPAGDVMLLLYCNLDPVDREEKMQMYLNFYYEQLKVILSKHKVNIDDVLSYNSFLNSAKEQRLWGLVVSACLTPQFWLDDSLTTQIFCDTAQFDDILTRNKSAFIEKIMKENVDYKKTVLCIFEEIVDRYCIN